MKKTLTFILILGLIFLGLATKTYAADVATLKATPDKTIIKAGEELKVVLSLTNYDATAPTITSASTKINYDTNIFEEITRSDISSEFVATYLDDDNNHELSIVSLSGIKENSDFATITFRAKSNITSTSTTITFKDNYADEAKISDIPLEITVGAEEIPATIVPEITLSKIEISKKPTKLVYKPGEKFDPTGMEITATYSDGTTKKVLGYTYEPTGELKQADNKVTISYKEGAVTKTVEQKITVNENEDLPDTGVDNFTVAMIAIIGMMIFSFIKFKKYSNV